MQEKPYIISITGTKGKTTIARMLDYIYRELNKYTLLVDTDGHYVNGKRKSTKKENMQLYELSATVSPGRFLYELKNKKNPMAILEASIGCSGAAGIGYLTHNIGIFTNVYEDHLSEKIKSRKQLAENKAKYIFKKISRNGHAIFNADDSYICKELYQIPENRNITFLPIGISFKYFDLKNHLNSNGIAITYKNNFIGILSKNDFKPIIDVKKISWTFNGQFLPSIYNLMLVFGAVYAEQKYKNLSEKIINLFYSYKLDNEGGRLTLIENKTKDIKILLDYAHEKYSLCEIANLAKKLSENKTIGVLRLAPNRTNNTIKKISKAIANKFDYIIIYDKVDGVNRERFVSIKTDLTREIGEVSQIFYDAISFYKNKKNTSFHILVEEKAIEKSLSLAEKGDVIVYIPAKSHKDGVQYSKKYLKKK